MRKVYALLSAMLLIASSSFSQLSGPKTIPGDYATIALAVTDLNTVGVGPGGVTFNVAGGYTETLSAALVLTIATNPSSAAKPVVFQRSGAGANPLITARTPGASLTVDGIFVINGADYITIDGIDLQENAANVTPTTQMEWGYALVKTSTTNGSQYNTIKNCSVTLNKANTASVGIYTGNHTSIITTALTVASFAGTNSYNKFYNNTVQNCFHGIDLNGYTTAAAPFDFYDQGNEIGAIGGGRNQVLNYGGGAAGTANGITCNAQNLVKIFKTNIDNSGGAATSTTLNGISTGTGTNANIDIYNDTVTLSSTATTSTLIGINNASGGSGVGNTINIYNCVVSNCTYTTATTGEFRGIAQTATASYTNIHHNTVSNNVVPGTGQYSGIYYGGSSSSFVLNVNINDNTVNGNTKSGASGQFNCIFASSSTVVTNCFNNLMYNNSAATSSTAMYGYYNFAFSFTENVYNNQYYNNSSGTGIQVGLLVSSGSGPTDKNVYGNVIHDLTGANQVGGINVDYGTNSSVYKNNIYNLSSTATSLAQAVYGIGYGSSSTNAGIYNTYNNFISDLRSPANTSTAAIYGIWVAGVSVSVYNVYNNSVYINASSSSVTTFGTAGIFLGTTLVSTDLRNNIVVNNSVPGPTGGNTVALQRATAPLTTYTLTSGYNCLYAGTPAANRLIYYDGTNSDQTLQAFKNRVGPREQASFSELPPFVNIGVAPYDLHLQAAVPTQCEKGGKPVGIVTQDYDGDPRNLTTPDVGADELNGVTTDIASPDIQYNLLGNSGVAATRPAPSFATITDPTGINSTAGTKPRLYYKKTTQANTFNDNTSGTDGWKYVEASNAVSPFDFTIDYSKLFGGGGVVAGDIIQYFVTAQDLNATPRIGLNNGGFTTQPLSVNLAAANFPLNNTINQYTIVANTYSGVIPVGPSETITSLTNAGGIFSMINAGALKGNVTISLTGDLAGETGTNALNQWAETDGSNYTVTISPSAAVTRTITGSHATLSLVRFDGADRVTIDGRFAGSGNFITLRNTSNSAPTVGFINDAQNNTVRNCIIESGNTATSITAGGAVFIGTTTGTQGNDNNTISNNEIRDRSDVAGNPAIGINCAGNTTTPAQANSGITISNNNIHDWYLQNSGSQFGIQVTTGNTNFTITGNSFYQTATRTHTITGAITRGINISNAAAATTSGGHDISGNFIGGSAPGATGSDMTLTVTGAGVSETFGGISVTTGLIPTSIQNNTIRGINFTTNAPTAAATVFFGINIGQGIFNIGTTTGNTIGAATGTGAISITVNAGGAVSSFLAGVLAAPINGYANINNNTVGGWTLAGTTVAGAFIPQYIQVQGTPNQNFSISNNLIGSTTTANSINATATAAPCVAFGIRLLISTGPSVTVANNIIQNVTDQSVATSSADYGILLINTAGANAPLTVTNNRISNFTGNALAATPTINTYGISLQGYGGNGHLFSGNSISAVYNANAGAGSGYVMGIQVQGSSTGGIMSKNKIYDLRNANTGAGPGIAGLYFSVGDGWNVNNNMISLNNNSAASAMNLFGIAEYCTGAFNAYYNSVYVGGNSTGALNSYAYQRGNNSRVNLKNNLFYNERTGGTAFHYAVGNTTATPGDGWTSASSSYNTFITAAPATVGEWGTGISQTFAQWKTSSAGDIESYADVNGNVPLGNLFTDAVNGDLTIKTGNVESWYVNGKGIAGANSASISTDYTGDPRNTTVGLPTDIGADEFTPNAGVLPPDLVASGVPVPTTITTYSFAGRKIGEINWGASVPSTISWKYYSGIPGPGTTGAVINSYQDVPATGSGSYNYSIKQYYTLAEQNQILDANLRGLKKDAGVPWYNIGGTPSFDADGKFVLSTGLTNFSQFTLKDVNNLTIPVTLLNFTAQRTGKVNVLNWSTSQEINTKNFVIEHSTDGRNFSDIGTVTAVGNSSTVSNYTFTHGNPVVGINYYRLRIVDRDNNAKYSLVRSVRNDGIADVAVYPNPVKNTLTVSISADKAGIGQMTISDVSGKLIYSKHITVAQGPNYLPVNLASLASGTYLIKVQLGDDFVVKKFNKL